jgi:hypothetical protein
MAGQSTFSYIADTIVSVILPPGDKSADSGHGSNFEGAAFPVGITDAFVSVLCIVHIVAVVAFLFSHCSRNR